MTRSSFDAKKQASTSSDCGCGINSISTARESFAHALALAALWSRPKPALVVNRGVSFPLDIWNRGKFRTHRVDRIVTVCEQIRRIVIKSARLPPEKVVVIYAGTDIDLFDPERWDPQSFRREKNISSDKFLIAQVGV